MKQQPWSIGIGMQDLTKGLLPAVVTAAVVIGFQQVIAKTTFKSKSIESITQGRFNTLVEDGCLMLQSMAKVGLSRERLSYATPKQGADHGWHFFPIPYIDDDITLSVRA